MFQNFVQANNQMTALLYAKLNVEKPSNSRGTGKRLLFSRGDTMLVGIRLSWRKG